MSSRKLRKTFSLDSELVRYLEQVQDERQAGSASSALEAILRESKRRSELQHIENQVAAYYGSLAEDEREAERNWGAFAESQFPEDRERASEDAATPSRRNLVR